MYTSPTHPTLLQVWWKQSTPLHHKHTLQLTSRHTLGAATHTDGWTLKTSNYGKNKRKPHQVGTPKMAALKHSATRVVYTTMDTDGCWPKRLTT